MDLQTGAALRNKVLTHQICMPTSLSNATQSDTYFSDKQAKRATTNNTLSRLNIMKFDHAAVQSILAAAPDPLAADREALMKKLDDIYTIIDDFG